MLANFCLASMEMTCHSRIENVVDQRGFTGSGDTCYRNQHAQREFDCEILQIVFFSTTDFNIAFRSSRLLSDRNCFSSSKIIPGERLFVFEQRFWAACVNHTTALSTGAWPKVDDMIGRSDGVFVMLHHDDGITNVSHF